MGISPLVFRRQAEAMKAREAVAKRNLISKLGLDSSIDPDMAEAIFQKLPETRTTTMRAKRVIPLPQKEVESLFKKSYQAEVDKSGALKLAEAQAAGSDPRTIQKIKSDLLSIYTKPFKKGGGKAQHVRAIQQRQAREQEEKLSKVKDILESEVRVQPKLEKIRRRTKEVAEQASIGMTRKRGKASLISGDAGGAGFFQRYFK